MLQFIRKHNSPNLLKVQVLPIALFCSESSHSHVEAVWKQQITRQPTCNSHSSALVTRFYLQDVLVALGNESEIKSGTADARTPQVHRQATAKTIFGDLICLISSSAFGRAHGQLCVTKRPKRLFSRVVSDFKYASRFAVSWRWCSIVYFDDDFVYGDRSEILFRKCHQNIDARGSIVARKQAWAGLMTEFIEAIA